MLLMIKTFTVQKKAVTELTVWKSELSMLWGGLIEIPNFPKKDEHLLAQQYEIEWWRRKSKSIKSWNMRLYVTPNTIYEKWCHSLPAVIRLKVTVLKHTEANF